MLIKEDLVYLLLELIKFQITNPKYQINNPPEAEPKSQIRNGFVLAIEYWNLRFICNLVLEIWDFKQLRRINVNNVQG